jgi:hypothetical protein
MLEAEADTAKSQAHVPKPYYLCSLFHQSFQLNVNGRENLPAPEVDFLEINRAFTTNRWTMTVTAYTRGELAVSGPTGLP